MQRLGRLLDPDAKGAEKDEEKAEKLRRSLVCFTKFSRTLCRLSESPRGVPNTALLNLDGYKKNQPPL